MRTDRLNRVREILYEASLIFLSGITIVGIAVALMHVLGRPSLGSFSREYLGSGEPGRIAIAKEYMQTYSARQLISQLDALSAGRQCHTEAHAIGRAVFISSRTIGDSIRICGTGCTYGCFHGALMEMFSTDSDTLGGVVEDDSGAAYLDHVESVARDICDRPEVQSMVPIRRCHHAIGHVFEYGAGADLKRAIKACGVFGDTGPVYACRSGVFMEYLGAVATTTDEYRKSAEPCDRFPDDIAECYRNKAYDWLVVWGGTEQAFKACDADGIDTMQCISTVANAAAMPESVATDEGFDRLCGTLTGERHEVCVRGALLKLFDLNEDDSEHVCDGVAVPYRARCLAFRLRVRALMHYDRI